MNSKEYKKVEIYFSVEGLQMLDDRIKALPDTLSGFSNSSLSEQRALLAGSLLSGLLNLFEELEPARVK